MEDRRQTKNENLKSRIEYQVSSNKITVEKKMRRIKDNCKLSTNSKKTI